MCDIKALTKETIPNFNKSVIVLDDTRDKLNKNICSYFSMGGQDDIEMIALCYKSAQIDNLARMIAETFSITTYDGTDPFKNFQEICNLNVISINQ